MGSRRQAIKSEVEEARVSALYEGRKFDRDPYCVIPEEIAAQKLFLHQAALDSIEVQLKLSSVWTIWRICTSPTSVPRKMEEYFNKTSSQIRETLRDNAREGLKVQKCSRNWSVNQDNACRGAPLLQRPSRQYSLYSDPGRGTDNHSAAESSFGRNRERKETFARFTDRITKGETSFFHVGVCIRRPWNGYQRRRMPFTGRGYLDLLSQTWRSICKTPIKYLRLWVWVRFPHYPVDGEAGDRIKVRRFCWSRIYPKR